MIDADAHSKLKTRDVENSATYKQLKAILQQIKSENNATCVYTLSPKDARKVVFVVDAETGEDYSHIGDEYDISPEIKQAMKSAPTFIHDFYTNQWGTFKSGFAPIKNKVISWPRKPAKPLHESQNWPIRLVSRLNKSLTPPRRVHSE
ncbi:hypothetical protein [Carboxydocella sp. ULO1]|uniref:hypothetical protein n=1 Tax=Carboxydocella sp. ULO1 TaxID=1926599 RepID=UPI0009AE453A|nr:hypothetical protein [Carboxydocella sp. ULO1]GAW28766.1 methyl-accepting chemotaxis sensory transducer [Carboxydocella sp. ULO1]